MKGAFEFSGYFPLIRIGSFEFPTYFIIISLAFCACVYWIVLRAEARALSRNRALDLCLWVMGSGFLGARLFHIIFEEPRYYFEAPLRVFEFWRGGFVWYGGALASFIAGLWFLRRHRMSKWVWLDLFAAPAALGYAIGRIACLLTGCCFGVVCVFPGGLLYRFPTQAFAVVWEIGALLALMWLERKQRAPRAPQWLRPAGQIFLVWIALHSAGRIFLEIFRDDPRGPMPLSLSLASWISLGVGAAALVLLKRRSRV